MGTNDENGVYSDFYKQVLEYWFYFYCKEPKTVNKIVHTDLFDNKYLLIDSKPVYYTKWLKAGIHVLGHILDKDGHLLLRDQLQEKYGIDVKQMDYNSITHCIPKRMLNMVKGKTHRTSVKTEISLSINCKDTPVGELTCRDIYWEYIREISELPKAEKSGENISI